jgi:lipopolysaccharide export system protein LptA
MTSDRWVRAAVPLALILCCGAATAAPAIKPFTPTPSPAAVPTAPVAVPDSAGGLETKDYRIQTDETHWNFNSGDFSMPKRVRFFRPGTDAVGDKATGNSKRGTATLIGNVVVHDSGNAPEAAGDSYSGNGTATLTCDQLEVDSKQKIYVATGHVHFSQGTRTGAADHGTLNRNTGTLQLQGRVRLTDGDQVMTASDLIYNLNTKDVDVRGGPIVIKQPVPASTGGTPTPKPKKRTLPF